MALPLALPLILAAGSAIAGAAGGAIGSAASSKDSADADKLRLDAYNRIANYNMPDITQEELDLLLPQLQGQLTPEMEEALLQQNSEMQNISVDPRLKQAQMRALEQMQQIGAEGLTEADMAALNQARRETAKDIQSREATIMANMAQRGMAGSGNELASRLMSAQAASERQAQEADRMAQMAQARKLEAIAQSGVMSGDIRGQEFGEQSAVAAAQDAINNFNTQNRQRVAGSNVDRRNTAAEKNLSEKQRISDQGVDIKNSQQQYNKELKRGLQQQNIDNYLNKEGIAQNATETMAQGKERNAKRISDMWTGIGSSVAGGLAGAASLAGGKK